MSRYIDADELVQKINAYVITTQDVEYIKKLINETEPADVAPVVHARWITGVNPNYSPFDGSLPVIPLCSNCCAMGKTLSRYCPHCGAIMDGGRK